jgi:hypothetical protein
MKFLKHYTFIIFTTRLHNKKSDKNVRHLNTHWATVKHAWCNNESHTAYQTEAENEIFIKPRLKINIYQTDSKIIVNQTEAIIRFI